MLVYLVGGLNPSEKYARQLGWLFPIYRNIKNVPNHQPAMIWDGSSSFFPINFEDTKLVLTSTLQTNLISSHLLVELLKREPWNLFSATGQLELDEDPHRPSASEKLSGHGAMQHGLFIDDKHIFIVLIIITIIIIIIIIIIIYLDDNNLPIENGDLSSSLS